jgi:hypothetical protein
MASRRPETDTLHAWPNFKPRGMVKENAGWILVEHMDGGLPDQPGRGAVARRTTRRGKASD